MITTPPTIGFIGAGNMATALIEGLLATGVSAASLYAADPGTEKLQALQALGVNACADNPQLVQACDVVVLAVKPQIMKAVLAPLQASFEQHPCLLISVAAGIRIASLSQWTHASQAIVRCMPNTPALVQAGASGLFANAAVTATQKAQASAILGAVGLACWLDNEAQLDAVTALSGSGPAYFFLMMEAMQAAGESLGLSPDVARQLCLQTAYGAAKLAQGSAVDIAELRRRVTSPGGTTEAAINQFEQDQFRTVVMRALEQAAKRSQELAAMNG